jgi:hypothetical protein
VGVPTPTTRNERDGEASRSSGSAVWGTASATRGPRLVPPRFQGKGRHHRRIELDCTFEAARSVALEVLQLRRPISVGGNDGRSAAVPIG